jgi:hypothetical protein
MVRRLLRLVIGLTLLTVLLAPSALAAKPTVEHIVEDEPFVFDCGEYGYDFAIRFDAVQELTIRTFYDRHGNPVRLQVHGHYRGTITNLGTGFSVFDRGNYMVTIDLNGEKETVVGLFYNLVVPGVGPIFQQIGRVVFDYANQTVTHSGPNDFFEGDSFAALCAAMNRA